MAEYLDSAVHKHRRNETLFDHLSSLFTALKNMYITKTHYDNQKRRNLQGFVTEFVLV